MAMQPPKKKGIGLWIGIGCGIVAVIAIAVVLVVKLLSGSAAKIGTAMANTFKETSQIQKDLNIIDMLIDGNASVQLDMEYARQTIGMSGTYDFSDKHKAVSMNVNGDLDGIGDFSADLAVELDKNKLAISLQPAVDEILT